MPLPFSAKLTSSLRVSTAAIRGSVSFLLALFLAACATTQPSLTQTDPPPTAHAPAHDASDAEQALDAALWDHAIASSAQDQQPAIIPDTHRLAHAALTHLGVKYRYGGKTPRMGFDCSGLVVYAAEQSLGITLPHHAASLARVGTSVKRTELQIGDLVFFNTRGRRFSHMGIYLGDHQFVHAPRTGAVVRIERMNTPYWQQRYNGARRLDTATLAALSSTRAS